MEKNQTKTIITMYGNDYLENKYRWKEWLSFSINFIQKAGYLPTHIAITSEKEFKSGKVIDFKKAQKRMEKAIETDDIIKNMELYSLPENFKQALFDYNVMTIKEENINEYSNISIIVQSDVFKSLDKNCLIREMKKLINLKEGELFEISYPENPMMYISKLNNASYYNTLNIIEKIR